MEGSGFTNAQLVSLTEPGQGSSTPIVQIEPQQSSSRSVRNEPINEREPLERPSSRASVPAGDVAEQQNQIAEQVDPEPVKQIDKGLKATLEEARQFWFNKFQDRYPEVAIVLAPHTVKLMNCCYIAVDRYAVLIGRAANTHPDSTVDHQIFGLNEYENHHAIYDVILQFFKELKPTKTYHFHVANLKSSLEKVSLATLLIAIWKFMCIFERDMDDDDYIRDVIHNTLFEERIENVPLGEIDAVLKGGKKSAFISAFVTDYTYTDGEPQTKVEEVSIVNFLEQYEMLYIRTDRSDVVSAKDYYFCMNFKHMIKIAFQNVAAVVDGTAVAGTTDQGRNVDYLEAEDTSDYFDRMNSIFNTLLIYSKSRVNRQRSEAHNYESDYLRVLQLIHKNYQDFIEGGQVDPEGMLLIVKKEAYKSHEQFSRRLVDIFNEASCGFKKMTIEKYGKGIRARGLRASDL